MHASKRIMLVQQYDECNGRVVSRHVDIATEAILTYGCLKMLVEESDNHVFL